MNAPHDLVLVQQLEAAAVLAPSEHAPLLIALAEAFDRAAEDIRVRLPGTNPAGV